VTDVDVTKAVIAILGALLVAIVQALLSAGRRPTRRRDAALTYLQIAEKLPEGGDTRRVLEERAERLVKEAMGLFDQSFLKRVATMYFSGLIDPEDVTANRLSWPKLITATIGYLAIALVVLELMLKATSQVSPRWLALTVSAAVYLTLLVGGPMVVVIRSGARTPRWFLKRSQRPAPVR
jgi:hypothetical protein